ncbi:MAG: YbaY family lipoprotein [Gemmatimonadales bacterium]
MDFLGGTIATLPAAALLAGVIGCARNPESSAEGTVTGTVAYRERMALPADAVVLVQLSDVSRQDVAARVLAETTIEHAGRQVPLPFELRYDPGAIEPRHSYAVRATIRSAGRLLYTTDTHAPVITRGNPTTVSLMLVRASGAARTAPAELWGTSWRLTDLGGVTPLEGAEATLEFPDRGKIAGRGSCNRFFGTVEITGESLTLRPVGSTRMACAEPVMAQEGKYLKALAAAERYSLDGDVLLIYSAGTDRPLRFTRTAS